MALYNWPEDYSFSAHREFLLQLAEEAAISPTKLEFDIGKDKRQRMSVTEESLAGRTAWASARVFRFHALQTDRRQLPEDRIGNDVFDR